jgi:hypothetical protein
LPTNSILLSGATQSDSMASLYHDSSKWAYCSAALIEYKNGKVWFAVLHYVILVDGKKINQSISRRSCFIDTGIPYPSEFFLA